MPQLSDTGLQAVASIAARHGFSIVRHTLLRARPQRAVYLLESR